MNISEIAPDVYRLSLFVPEINLQFNQIINPTDLRWIGFSHFEADECGALNEWLEVAPNATSTCSLVGAMVSVDDFASRPAKGLADGETSARAKTNFALCKLCICCIAGKWVYCLKNRRRRSFARICFLRAMMSKHLLNPTFLKPLGVK